MSNPVEQPLWSEIQTKLLELANCKVETKVHACKSGPQHGLWNKAPFSSWFYYKNVNRLFERDFKAGIF